MLNGRLEIPSRQALVKYGLQRYQIDPKNLDPKPEAQQVVIANLNALKPWLYDSFNTLIASHNHENCTQGRNTRS